MKLIITENRLHNFFKKRGLTKTIRDLRGLSNFIKTYNLETPTEFLNLFNDLEIVESEERKDYVLYRLKPGDNYFIYHKKTNEVSVKYDIWRILEDIFDEPYMRVQLITQRWVGNVYDLNNVVTLIMNADSEKML